MIEAQNKAWWRVGDQSAFFFLRLNFSVHFSGCEGGKGSQWADFSNGINETPKNITAILQRIFLRIFNRFASIEFNDDKFGELID